MAEQCSAFEGRITGMATVYPGEDDAGNILKEAFDAGFGGLKLHAHVQCYDMNSDTMNPLYEWDRELKILAADKISEEALERIAYKNAAEFFNLGLIPTKVRKLS